MNVDLLMKENIRLNEEAQRYKEMWFTTNNSLAKYRKLEQDLGCPLEIREKALKQCEFKGLYFETKDTDGFERVGVYKCYLCYDAFNNKFYWNCGWNAETWLNCYKKTWWLKEDKSE